MGRLSEAQGRAAVRCAPLVNERTDSASSTVVVVRRGAQTTCVRGPGTRERHSAAR